MLGCSSYLLQEVVIMAVNSPLAASSSAMSEAKRKFWSAEWRVSDSAIGQTRVAVFHFVMNTTPRPTNLDHSLALGYALNEKLHDREPALIVRKIEEHDPTFFNEYPRSRKSVSMAERDKCAAVGEAARAFYRHGAAAYGKEGLRKSNGGSGLGGL